MSTDVQPITESACSRDVAPSGVSSPITELDPEDVDCRDCGHEARHQAESVFGLEADEGTVVRSRILSEFAAAYAAEVTASPYDLALGRKLNSDVDLDLYDALLPGPCEPIPELPAAGPPDSRARRHHLGDTRAPEAPSRR